jgi:hypothetical protein
VIIANAFIYPYIGQYVRGCVLTLWVAGYWTRLEGEQPLMVDGVGSSNHWQVEETDSSE